MARQHGTSGNDGRLEVVGTIFRGELGAGAEGERKQKQKQKQEGFPLQWSCMQSVRAVKSKSGRVLDSSLICRRLCKVGTTCSDETLETGRFVLCIQTGSLQVCQFAENKFL